MYSIKLRMADVSSSFHDRAELVRLINSLPPSQLDFLVFVLKPPIENIPPASASPGSRTIALLQWAESPIGCGLQEVKNQLEAILDSSQENRKNFFEAKEQYEEKIISEVIRENTALEYKINGLEALLLEIAEEKGVKLIEGISSTDNNYLTGDPIKIIRNKDLIQDDLEEQINSLMNYKKTSLECMIFNNIRFIVGFPVLFVTVILLFLSVYLILEGGGFDTFSLVVIGFLTAFAFAIGVGLFKWRNLHLIDAMARKEYLLSLDREIRDKIGQIKSLSEVEEVFGWSQELIETQNLREILCPYLIAIADDANEVSRVITPFLIIGVLSGLISISLTPVLISAISITIAKTGVSNMCI